MKWTPLSRASAITCSAGSPVRNASRPSAIASPKLDAAAARDDRRRCARARGPAVPHERLLPERARRSGARSSANGTPSAERPTKPIGAAAVLAERLGPLEPERRADQRVVADLGVGVERQVVAGERDVGVEQHAQAAPSSRARSRAGGSPRTARGGRATSCAPRRGRPLEQLAMRGDAGGHDANLVRARHLEPVRPVVVEGARSRAARRGRR